MEHLSEHIDTEKEKVTEINPRQLRAGNLMLASTSHLLQLYLFIYRLIRIFCQL